MEKLLKTLSLLVLGVVSIFAFSSCADDSPAPPPQAASKLEVPENPYLITQEQAIEYLKEFGATFYESESRAGELPETKKLYLIVFQRIGPEVLMRTAFSTMLCYTS